MPEKLVVIYRTTIWKLNARPRRFYRAFQIYSNSGWQILASLQSCKKWQTRRKQTGWARDIPASKARITRLSAGARRWAWIMAARCWMKCLKAVRKMAPCRSAWMSLASGRMWGDPKRKHEALANSDPARAVGADPIFARFGWIFN